MGLPRFKDKSSKKRMVNKVMRKKNWCLGKVEREREETDKNGRMREKNSNFKVVKGKKKERSKSWPQYKIGGAHQILVLHRIQEQLNTHHSPDLKPFITAIATWPTPFDPANHSTLAAEESSCTGPFVYCCVGWSICSWLLSGVFLIETKMIWLIVSPKFRSCSISTTSHKKQMVVDKGNRRRSRKELIEEKTKRSIMLMQIKSDLCGCRFSFILISEQLLNHFSI